VVCLKVIGVRGYRRAEVFERGCSIALRELIYRTVTKLLGRCLLRFVHDIL